MRNPLASLLIAATLGAGVLVSGASAAPVAPAPGQQPTAPQQPPPGPQPASAQLSLRVVDGLYEGRHRYELAGSRLVVQGSLKPYVAGEVVTVELFRGKRRVGRVRSGLRKVHGAGYFSVTVRARTPGNYSVQARHDATAAQGEAHAQASRFSAIAGAARPGGVALRLLQRTLGELGYVNSRSGRYDGATALALLAYRKVNRMARIGTAGDRIFARLFRHEGGFRLRYPHAGRHAEFDFSRQVLVLADHGRVERIYHASSGKPSTPTVFGTFSFYYQQPGTNSKGMFDSSYFTAGYAIHGYPSVPTYAASHGCIRVPMSDAVSIYNWVRLGNRIFVYR